MIIIKFIILYFIQITHTDDFSQRVYRLVLNNSQSNNCDKAAPSSLR